MSTLADLLAYAALAAFVWAFGPDEDDDEEEEPINL